MATSTLASLNELTAPVKTDEILVQDDPSGSPEDKRMTLENALETPVPYNDLEEGAAPDDPSSGDVRIYAKTDGLMYSRDDAGNETLMSAGFGNASNLLCQCRLTPTTAKPVEGSDQLSYTSVYITPFEGDLVRVYDGSNWVMRTLTEIEVKLTDDAQTGDTTNGSAVITALTDTSHFVAGQVVSGVGIPVGAVISTVDSATQVTLDQNATADGSGVALTFKDPASSAFDIFLYDDSGTLKADKVIWTDLTTRATAITTQDGIEVLTGSTGKLLVGSYRTMTTAGESKWNRQYRTISNRYNQTRFELRGGQQSSHAVSSTSYVEMNGSDTTRAYFMLCKEQRMRMRAGGQAYGASGRICYFSIGLDGTTNSDSYRHEVYGAGASQDYYKLGWAIQDTYVAAGGHYYTGLEKVSAACQAIKTHVEADNGFLC
jgi:hypothetical protein